MKLFKFLIIFTTILSFMTLPARAEQADLKYFTSGSYQQLLKEYADKPFVLMVWSIHCTTCLQKMPLLNELSKNMPGVNLVMLATDDASASDQVKSILVGNELNKLDNWIFADANAQKLRYEIDPKWYGEVPRTYFVDKNHQRVGVSGALSRETYETMLKEIFN
ncbi:MAG TPA: TlpA disulfide reductase family protein [Nitrosomonas sp.]|nr:TlpA family protein disulfide reductase [Nitrosomonas sp.]MBP9872263.1 TlpA family protein disulfide reductase [Nitrosomonas sp.]MDO8334202.1 TlpA disulfide reductase family protein [Nitrosomonas sp.]HQV89296.1 TlpA disulfide reductase family protein [Nitrosomonas sp.]HRB96830.1 TlpA disulfide reductase family protein [Nitrosomonas sp.]